ncbi:MAG: DUF2125 domain-containing protein [Alphaproteobacteria bacterium]|nr:DUF2125 domain-containing protein [Alphaproteobacteria bacterium]
MRYSSRFFLYAPFLLLLVLAGVAAGHWWLAAGALEKQLETLKGHEAVPGVTLDWRAVVIGGFPFRLDATFDGFTAKGAGPRGPFAWTTDKFAVHALTYGAEKDVFEAAGNQHLAWTDGSGASHSLAFLPGSLRASAVRDGRGLSRFDVDIVELGGKDISIGRAQFHLRRDPDGQSLDLMAEGDLVKAPGPLGGVRTFHVYQTLSQAASFAPLLAGQARAPGSHARWLAAGGTARITAAEWNGAKTLTPEQRDAAMTLLSAVY